MDNVSSEQTRMDSVLGRDFDINNIPKNLVDHLYNILHQPMDVVLSGGTREDSGMDSVLNNFSFKAKIVSLSTGKNIREGNIVVPVHSELSSSNHERIPSKVFINGTIRFSNIVHPIYDIRNSMVKIIISI